MKSALTVLGLEAENFKRLRLVRLSLDPTGVVQIRGRNGEGKSSAIDAVWGALGGLRQCPDDPIRHGKRYARARLDLGDLTVERSWIDPEDPSASRLVVMAKGERVRSPQSVLDALMGKFADPSVFISMPPQDQIREVLGMVDLGIDLDASRDREAELCSRRKALRDGVASLEARAKALRRDLGEPIEDFSGSVESAEKVIDEANAAEKQHREAVAAVVEAETTLDHHRQVLGMVDDRVHEIEVEIAGLKVELEKAQAQSADMRETWEEAERKAQAAREALRALPCPDPLAVQEAREYLRQVAEQREKIAAHKADEARLAEVQAQLDESREEFEQTEEAIAKVRGERKAALAALRFPVEGLSFDGEQLLLGGVPIEQASQAEQLLAAAELAMAQDVRCHLLFLRQASLFDSATLGKLDALARERGWQILAEVVADQDDGVGVWIEDGTAEVAR